MKTRLIYLFLLLILVSCEKSEVKPVYDFTKFHNELLSAAEKLKTIKQAMSSGRINADEYQISEEDALAIINPLVSESTLLIESYGININGELGVMTNQDIVVGALSIYRAEILLANGYTLEQIEDELNQEYISTNSDILDCLGDVLLVGGIVAGLNGGAKWLSKELAIKAIKKVAVRFLGPIGAMFAIYEFSDCMGWL